MAASSPVVILVIAYFVLCLAQVGQSLTCFKCNSREHGAICDDPFNKDYAETSDSSYGTKMNEDSAETNATSDEQTMNDMKNKTTSATSPTNILEECPDPNDYCMKTKTERRTTRDNQPNVLVFSGTTRRCASPSYQNYQGCKFEESVGTKQWICACHSDKCNTGYIIIPMLKHVLLLALLPYLMM